MGKSDSSESSATQLLPQNPTQKKSTRFLQSRLQATSTWRSLEQICIHLARTRQIQNSVNPREKICLVANRICFNILRRRVSLRLFLETLLAQPSSQARQELQMRPPLNCRTKAGRKFPLPYLPWKSQVTLLSVNPERCAADPPPQANLESPDNRRPNLPNGTARRTHVSL